MVDERAFLKSILEKPDDDSRKLVYADWLEEQGDPRAEFLRLMVKVRQEQALTAHQRERHQELSAELAKLRSEDDQAFHAWLADTSRPRRETDLENRIEMLEGQLTRLSKEMRRPVSARLQELAATLDPNWLAVVSDPKIEGCGKSIGESREFRFAFVCDKTWADLTATRDTRIRHCETCRENVHFCDTLADAREHSHEGHCIAVDLGIIRHDGDLRPTSMFMGRPTKKDLRQSYERDVDEVSQARLAASKQTAKARKRKK
jgi:uncharacterized protein (TIGR02996 family)